VGHPRQEPGGPTGSNPPPARGPTSWSVGIERGLTARGTESHWKPVSRRHLESQFNTSTPGWTDLARAALRGCHTEKAAVAFAPPPNQSGHQPPMRNPAVESPVTRAASSTPSSNQGPIRGARVGQKGSDGRAHRQGSRALNSCGPSINHYQGG